MPGQAQEDAGLKFTVDDLIHQVGMCKLHDMGREEWIRLLTTEGTPGEDIAKLREIWHWSLK
jgi:hypothetical protein